MQGPVHKLGGMGICVEVLGGYWGVTLRRLAIEEYNLRTGTKEYPPFLCLAWILVDQRPQ